MPDLPTRRRFLCCGALAATGLFSALAEPAAAAAADEAHALRHEPFVREVLDGLDPSALWDVHTHLLGTGDGGSGCRIDPRQRQWWHPVEALRHRVILDAAGVSDAPGGIDAAYVRRLQALAAAFPPGARWLLYAFDEAHDADGRPRQDWTTFHVPDAHARAVAAADPARFGWVASVHPRRPDALDRLDAALAGGALAVKWLPSAMAIDLRDPRHRPFYRRLAAAGRPLIVHCGAEHAVPGAGRDDFGHPLHLRAPLAEGVRVIAAHCASAGRAPDTDHRGAPSRSCFSLFERLMDEPEHGGRLLGDLSAVFQRNRAPAVWRRLLAREDWHPRLLHGSDYPLPGVGWLYDLGGLVEAGVLARDDLAPLQALKARHPLLFDLALRRRVRWQGRGFAPSVFATRRHFDGA